MSKISKLVRFKNISLFILIVSILALFLSIYAVKQKQLINSSARTTEGECESNSQCVAQLGSGYICSGGYCVLKNPGPGGGGRDITDRNTANQRLGKSCSNKLGGSCIDIEKCNTDTNAMVANRAKGNDCPGTQVCCLKQSYESIPCSDFSGTATCRSVCFWGNGEILLDDVNGDGISDKPFCDGKKKCCFR